MPRGCSLGCRNVSTQADACTVWGCRRRAMPCERFIERAGLLAAREIKRRQFEFTVQDLA